MSENKTRTESLVRKALEQMKDLEKVCFEATQEMSGMDILYDHQDLMNQFIKTCGVKCPHKSVRIGSLFGRLDQLLMDLELPVMPIRWNLPHVFVNRAMKRHSYPMPRVTVNHKEGTVYRPDEEAFYENGLIEMFEKYLVSKTHEKQDHKLNELVYYSFLHYERSVFVPELSGHTELQPNEKEVDALCEKWLKEGGEIKKPGYEYSWPELEAFTIVASKMGWIEHNPAKETPVENTQRKPISETNFSLGKVQEELKSHRMKNLKWLLREKFAQSEDKTKHAMEEAGLMFDAVVVSSAQVVFDKLESMGVFDLVGKESPAVDKLADQLSGLLKDYDSVKKKDWDQSISIKVPKHILDEAQEGKTQGFSVGDVLVYKDGSLVSDMSAPSDSKLGQETFQIPIKKKPKITGCDVSKMSPLVKETLGVVDGTTSPTQEVDWFFDMMSK